jgi:hypothetical protein
MGIMNASLAKMLQKTLENQPLQNIILFKDSTERELKIDVLGKPESHGAWCVVGDDEASAMAFEFEADKEKVFEKIWWEEETQLMYRTLHFSKTNRHVIQTRKVEDEDRMVLMNKTIRADGESNVFDVKFKRIG